MLSVFRYYMHAKAIRFKFIIQFVSQRVFMHTNISFPEYNSMPDLKQVM